MLEINETGDGVTFTVRVAPRATRTEVAGVHDGALKVRIAAPPVEGAANEELMRFLARALGVPTRAVEIVAGHTSKTKRVRVRGVAARQILGLVRED